MSIFNNQKDWDSILKRQKAEMDWLKEVFDLTDEIRKKEEENQKLLLDNLTK